MVTPNPIQLFPVLEEAMVQSLIVARDRYESMKMNEVQSDVSIANPKC